jgi:hypothetical protein
MMDRPLFFLFSTISWWRTLPFELLTCAEKFSPSPIAPFFFNFYSFVKCFKRRKNQLDVFVALDIYSPYLCTSDTSVNVSVRGSYFIYFFTNLFIWRPVWGRVINSRPDILQSTALFANQPVVKKLYNQYRYIINKNRVSLYKIPILKI